MSDAIELAVIGGSGLYAMNGLASIEHHELLTPFGKPSAPIVTGLLDDHRVAFLARHGLGHGLTPSEIPYLANLYALKMLGAERIVSVSAVGSLREDYAPGQIVVPDQIYDNTRGRRRSFFGEGLVAHVGVANPFCSDLSSQLELALQEAGAIVHHGGSLITIEGPRFSTRAESHTYRAWGMSLIGMTTSPEAFLAREAEMCYAVMAHVTDYDVWHVDEEPVTVEKVIQTLNRNTQLAQEAIRRLLGLLHADRRCDCSRALANALITQPSSIPDETRQKLNLLVGKYLH